MASAFGESVLRLDQSMNVLLLLTVNIVAIPMTLVFGKLADIKGTKFALMLALLIYCFVAVVAAGFAPLELDGKEDAERYDFQFEFNEESGEYELMTLYDRGYENWVGETSAGDSEFRDNFQQYFPDNSTDYQKDSAGSSTLGAGLLACVIILGFVAILGGAIMFIQNKELGMKGIFAIVIVVIIGLLSATMLAGQADSKDEETFNISTTDANSLHSAFDNAVSYTHLRAHET